MNMASGRDGLKGHHRTRWRMGITVLVMLAAGAAVTAQTQDHMPLSVAVQWETLAKVMTFERRLVQIADTVVVGIVYQGRVRESDLVRIELERAIDELSVAGGLSFGHRVIDIGDGSDLEAQVRDAPIDVIYIAPLRAVGADRVARLCHEAGLLTMTGVPRYVDQGVGVGVDLTGTRLALLVNLNAVRRSGTELSARILALSRIVD